MEYCGTRYSQTSFRMDRELYDKDESNIYIASIPVVIGSRLLHGVYSTVARRIFENCSSDLQLLHLEQHCFSGSSHTMQKKIIHIAN
mmetsp:Transcript_21711/g.53639  ORF Transcript_21711/g.53639 Transcript_21711/m.53639 type:complete len:87 (+) Transcript_21711:91-351(+)